MRKTCTNCQAEFECSATSYNGCWCMSYPALLPASENTSCLCSDCLREALVPEVKSIVQEILQKKRSNEVAQLYHSKASKKLIEGIDFYREDSLWVLTEWFHLKRGYCCGNKCRHCPYDHENVR